jgi:hypothetical protein
MVAGLADHALAAHDPCRSLRFSDPEHAAPNLHLPFIRNEKGPAEAEPSFDP